MSQKYQQEINQKSINPDTVIEEKLAIVHNQHAYFKQ